MNRIPAGADGGVTDCHAAIYARVSSQQQAERGLSLPEQEKELLNMATAMGCDAEVFVEPGRSGRRGKKRPELERLLASLGHFDYLFVWKLDRLARSNVDLWKIVGQLDDHDVALLSRTEGLDSRTPAGRMILSVLGSVAETEVANIAERVSATAAARVRRRQRRYGGGRAAWGRDRDDRVILVDVPYILEAARRVIAGESELEICRSFNSRGYTTPEGNRWTPGSLRTCLLRTHLGGHVRVPNTDELLLDVLEPILAQDDYVALHAVYEARRRAREPRGRSTGAPFLLDGPLTAWCGCGSPMMRQSGRKKPDGSWPYASYVCKRREDEGRDACPTGRWRRDVVDGLIFGAFERAHHDEAATRGEVEMATRRATKEMRGLLRSADREVAKAEARLALQRRRWRDGELTTAEWRAEQAELGAERSVAGAEVERLRARAEQIKADGTLRDAQAETVAHLARVREAIAAARSGDDQKHVAAAEDRTLEPL